MKKTYMNKLLALVAVMAFAMTALQAQTFTVDAPASIAGEYTFGGTVYGPLFGSSFSGPVVEVTDSAGETTACVEITDDLSGSIALIDRGGCGFVNKTLAAQAAGAAGVIICNNDMVNPDTVITLGGSDACLATIPTVMLSFNDCQTIRMETGVTVTYVQADPPPPAPDGWDFETAIEVTEGTYTVDSIPTNGNTFTNATGELWYKYTAPADGVLNISSCASPTATRLIVTVHPNGCAADLNIYDVAVGGCPDSDGSVLDIIVEEGSDYYLVWDNPLSSDGFDFTLTQGAFTEVDITFNVDMQNEVVSADGVNMVVGGPGVDDVADVGIFAMTDDDGDGIYSAIVPVTTLDTIGYAFVNGGVDPANVEMIPDSCFVVPSGFGFNVRPFINTAIEPASVGAVCFGACGPCPLVEATCDNPTVILSEDFEGDTAGEAPGAAFIQPWSADWTTAVISDEFAFSGSLSHEINGVGGDDDPIYLLNSTNITEGHYVAQWNMYIPEGNGAYYNFQKDVMTAVEWGFQLHFDGDGTGRLEAGSPSSAEPRARFTYPEGEWFQVVNVIDVDNNLARVHVNGTFVSSWPLTFATFATDGLQSIGSVNFFPIDETYRFFIDDFLFALIPDPAEGLYCQSATPVEAGTVTVDSLDCFGGGFFYRQGDGTGLQSRWFSYTAAADGYITISSCGNPEDTRAYILGGSCDDLAILGANDDRCEMANGNPWATLAEAPVTAGETYYIVWDDYWSSNGFDFELTFTEGELPESNFCASALAVEPGTYTTSEFGEASVAFGTLGASSSPTSAIFAPQMYVGSAWYSFTPEEDGLVGITSCDSGEDTYVIVYTGTCDNVNSLEAVTFSDDEDGCGTGFSSNIQELEVTAGTTYYIEWIDLWDNVEFEWELTFMLPPPPTVNVQLAVDVSLLIDAGELSADGVFLAGSFSDFNNVQMSDLDGDNIYTATVQIPENSSAEYKFKNGPDGWETVDTSIGDENCATGEFGNRVIEVGDAPLVVDPVCFAYCVPCQTVDVSDLALEQGVAVFPNPAKDVLNVQIDLPEVANRLNIRLINALGQVVLSRDLGTLQSDNIELDVRNLAAGTYMLQVVDGQAQFTQSVVIQ